MSDPAEICLSFAVRQAWLTMRVVMDEALAPHHLSTAQYATLLVLEEQPDASVADIARAVASSRQSANELVAAMEQAGLVVRRDHPHDRRTQQVRLSAQGRRRLAAARPDVHAREAELERDFTVAQRETVRAWLAAMAQTGRDGAPRSGVSR